MTLVAIIVAKDQKLSPRAAADLRANLPNAQEPNWLSENEACEISFAPSQNLDKKARRELASALRDNLSLSADIAVLPAGNRRKKLMIADMDSTMIGQECLDELAREAGFYDKVAAITESAMRGEIEFEPALRERVALLRSLPASVIDDVLKKRITYNDGAKTLVMTMKKHGALTALVSGGFTLFTQPVTDALGFDWNSANTLGVENGLLTGDVASPIVGREAKKNALLELCAQRQLETDDTFAIGDGANDMAMIETAGLGIAFHAKPVLADVADAEIRYGDLHTALYYQGYKRAEFVN
ncbi:MAG: phosphoserine phosphatase SerB [Pseudomonadota bacterium]